MREQSPRPTEGRALQALGTRAKALRQHPWPEGSKAHFCFPMRACRPFHSQVTSSTLPLPCPHFYQLLGSKSDSPMVHLGQRVQEIQRPLCFPLATCNVAPTALKLYWGRYF